MRHAPEVGRPCSTVDGMLGNATHEVKWYYFINP
jgi:hypothetical protein